MGKSSPPPAPDYTAAAQATANSSAQVTNQQTYANRPDIYTPFGSQTYSTTAGVDPSTGQAITKWTQNDQLTPDAQAALASQQQITQGKSDAALGLLNQATGAFNTPTDFSQQPGLFQFSGPSSLNTSASAAPNLQSSFGGYGSVNANATNSPTLQSSVGSPGGFNQQASDAIYSRSKVLLDQNRESTEAQLANQGITQGSEAWQRAQDQLGRNENDAQNQATMAGFTQANTEYNQALAGAGLYNSANQTGFQDTLASQAAQNQAQAQQFGQSNTAATFGNTAANQGFQNGLTAQSAQNQALTGQQNLNTSYGNYQVGQQQAWDQNTEYQRSNSLNELNALLTGQQVSNPTFDHPNATAQQSQAVDYTGAAKSQYGAAADATSAANANASSTASTVGAVAGIAAMFF